jgi:hypothetical protein
MVLADDLAGRTANLGDVVIKLETARPPTECRGTA